MINLAGREDCDKHIRRELERARVEVVEGERSTHEVAASITGKLGAFTFERAWYYWVVSGPVPIAVAQELYVDPVGVTDVRSGGDCACRPPETWATYYDADGRQIAVDTDGSQEEWFRDCSRAPSDWERKYRFVRTKDERAAITASAMVENYHIDSEVGLRLFADTVRRLP